MSKPAADVGATGAGGSCGTAISAPAEFADTKLGATFGAIIAFSIFSEPQTGHVTSLRFACLS